MGDFLKTKFDNLSLFIMISGFVAVLVWSDVHASDKLVSWMEQTITTVLGAYIGLTQVHRLPWNKTGGASDTTTPTASNGASATDSTTH